MTQLHLLDNPVDLLEGEVVAAFFFVDERPLSGSQALLDWRLNGLLTQLLVQNSAHGAFGENILLRSNGKIASDWVLFVGGGKRRGLGADGYRRLLDHLFAVCRRAGFVRVALGLGLLEGLSSSALQGMVRASLDAVALGGLECLLSIADDNMWLV